MTPIRPQRSPPSPLTPANSDISGAEPGSAPALPAIATRSATAMRRGSTAANVQSAARSGSVMRPPRSPSSASVRRADPSSSDNGDDDREGGGHRLAQQLGMTPIRPQRSPPSPLTPANSDISGAEP